MCLLSRSPTRSTPFPLTVLVKFAGIIGRVDISPATCLVSRITVWKGDTRGTRARNESLHNTRGDQQETDSKGLAEAAASIPRVPMCYAIMTSSLLWHIRGVGATRVRISHCDYDCWCTALDIFLTGISSPRDNGVDLPKGSPELSASECTVVDVERRTSP